MPLTSLVIIIFAVLSLTWPNIKVPSVAVDFFASQAKNQTSSKDTTPREKISTRYQKIPFAKNHKTALEIDAKSAIIVDPVSQKVLFEKNSDQDLAMASLTKIMTALVIIQKHKLDEIVTIPALPPDEVEGSQKVGLSQGEKFKLSQALRILLIYSANDMANALAIWDSGTIEKFVERMNQEAKWWQLKDTQYKNPTGLDNSDQKTSASDLVRLSRILLTSPTLSEIVKTSSYQVKSESGKIYNLASTNQLLFSRNDIYGVKTGFDSRAGQCLITLAKRGDAQVLTVILDSPDRFQESQNMVEWAFDNHTRQ